MDIVPPRLDFSVELHGVMLADVAADDALTRW
jgi:hypothetical protein